ncbi:MAG: monovalent cation/H(+) antiporter subunit G [Chloroflexota bacterium]|nr:monovalent cation/H(+) antiporter subunit G [Chloroflexota bacterium]
MTDLLIQLAGVALLITGTLFCILGVYGMFRLPDIYNRLHATAMALTLGAGGILLSLLFLAPLRAGLKGLTTAIFLLLTAPMVTHTLSRAAYRLGIPLASHSVRDDLAEDQRAAGGEQAHARDTNG